MSGTSDVPIMPLFIIFCNFCSVLSVTSGGFISTIFLAFLLKILLLAGYATMICVYYSDIPKLDSALFSLVISGVGSGLLKFLTRKPLVDFPPTKRRQ